MVNPFIYKESERRRAGDRCAEGIGANQVREAEKEVEGEGEGRDRERLQMEHECNTGEKREKTLQIKEMPDQEMDRILFSPCGERA